MPNASAKLGYALSTHLSPVLCLLLLVTGSFSSLKNPASGGKTPLLVGAICALISFGFYLAVTCLLFMAALDVPEVRVRVRVRVSYRVS